MLHDTPRVSSRLDLLYLVTSEFNAGLEINEVLFNVLTATVASVGASEATLFLVNDHGQLKDDIIIRGFKRQTYPLETLKYVFENGVVDWVRRHQRGIIISNTQSDPVWYTEPVTPEIAQAISVVAVPLQKPPQNPIGILTITTDRENYFDDSDLAMLTIIADQAAFALTNAQLFEAEQHRRKVADTLTSIAHTINATLDLKEVLDLILEQLSLVVDYDSSSVLLYEQDDTILAVKAARGFSDMADALNVRIPYNEESPNFQAILQQKPIVIDNVDDEPNWVKSKSSEAVKSWIGAPLIARGRVVGILTVDSYETNTYSTNNVRVVAAFADQAATAVANAQAVTQLQQAEASYSALFEDSTDMIVITDYQGSIHNINRKGCQILRRPKDAVLGLEITFFAPQLKRFLVEQSKLLKAWREASIDIEIEDAYRQKIPLEIRVRNIMFGGTEFVEWVGRDISQRKEIERMRQDLVNMLVHDLRGPLGNLINTIDLVRMLVSAKGEDANLIKFLEMGKRTGRTLTDLVDSMLDVSRLEQGEVPVQRIETSLARANRRSA
jgi:PAS domain S-box-containing protein